MVTHPHNQYFLNKTESKFLNRKKLSTFLPLLDSPDHFSFSFGKLFSLLPTAFRMNKIPFPLGLSNFG